MDIANIIVAGRDFVSPDLTTAGLSDTVALRSVNRWYRRIFSWIVNDMGNWQINGNKLSEDLQTDVTAYQFSLTQLVAISRVEVNYNSERTDTYVEATVLSAKETEEGLQNGVTALASSGAPRYRIFGDTIEIYPTPTVEVENGLVVEFIDDLTDLDLSVNTTSLINPLVDQILAMGIAYDHLRGQRDWKAMKEMKQEIFGDYDGDPKGLKQNMIDLVTNFDRGPRPQIKPRRMSYK